MLYMKELVFVVPDGPLTAVYGTSTVTTAPTFRQVRIAAGSLAGKYLRLLPFGTVVRDRGGMLYMLAGRRPHEQVAVPVMDWYGFSVVRLREEDDLTVVDLP